MDAIRQFIEVPADRRIVVKLPEEIEVGRSAEVVITIRDSPARSVAKYEEMLAAATDPLLQADIREAGADYAVSDGENW